MSRITSSVSIPNILTLVRILLTPVFVILLLRDMFSTALLVFAAAGISDAYGDASPAVVRVGMRQNGEIYLSGSFYTLVCIDRAERTHPSAADGTEPAEGPFPGLP